MQASARAVRLTTPATAKAVRSPLFSSGLAPVRPHSPNRILPLPTALPGTADVELPVERSDLPGYVAIAGLAASQVSSFSLTPELLYSSLAVYQLVYTLLSVVDGKFGPDRVANVISPAFLGSAALGFFNGYLTAFQAATAAFGYYLAKDLPGPLALWLASLAYAIYSGHPAEWAVAAFGLAAAYKVYNAVKDKTTPAPQQVLFLAFAGYSIYANIAQQAALLIFGGHVLASTIS